MKKEIKEILGENIVLLIFLLILIVSFLFIKYNFLTDVQVFDNFVSEYVQKNFVSDGLTAVMKYVTSFGGEVVLVLLIIVTFIGLKNKLYSFLMALNLSFVFIFNTILKNIFVRPRPVSTFIPDITGYSFPSSHAMCSIAFYGLLAYFTVKYVSNKFLKVIVIIFFSILILGIGFSRIYLNVHYFTDVVSGFLIGIVALGIFVNIMKKYLKE